MTEQQCAEQLKSVCQSFCDELKTAYDVGGIEAAFSQVLGSEAAQVAKDTKNKKHRKMLKEAFREGLADLISISGSLRHILEKPYGYPGDFAILEHVYDCKPLPTTTDPVGRIADVWGLSRHLPTAVTARKDLLRSFLERFPTLDDAPIRILSLASGSAREIRELSPLTLESMDIKLIDFDKNPLEFAKSYFAAQPWQPRIDYIVGDVIKGEGDDGFTDESFDLIYSFGLYDYLPDKYIAKSISQYLKYLKPDGKFVFALKDVTYYDAFLYDFMFDWRFVPRVKDDGFSLAAAHGLKVERTYTVDNRIINVFECTKQP